MTQHGRGEVTFVLCLLGLVFLIVVGIGPVFLGQGPVVLNALQDRPWILTRGTAATAINRSAQFRHKTKLRFEITQAEGFISGVCHNFDFEPTKLPVVKAYHKAGTIKFSAYRNQMPPFPGPSTGSIDLSIGDSRFLSDHIEPCKTREVASTTGAYEVSLGKTVVEVTGIQKNGSQAVVYFRWHFESINEIGQALPRVQIAREQEMGDPHLTSEEKAIAPFWTGSAEFSNYDDGWRIANMKFSAEPWDEWAYGPDWPDPEFDWGWNENENRWKRDQKVVPMRRRSSLAVSSSFNEAINRFVSDVRIARIGHSVAENWNPGTRVPFCSVMLIAERRGSFPGETTVAC
jgi:hypothetical protein